MAKGKFSSDELKNLHALADSVKQKDTVTTRQIKAGADQRDFGLFVASKFKNGIDYDWSDYRFCKIKNPEMIKLARQKGYIK